MLSDRTIRLLLDKADGQLSIKAPGKLWDVQLQPASVDLRLGSVAYKVFNGDEHDKGAWMIHPGQFRLGSTMETVELGHNLCGRVEGKSTWARRGLLVHCAGFVDPGFSGELTLELFNMGSTAIELRRGDGICQIAFDWMDTTVDRAYGDPGLGSHYQGQSGPTPAKS